MDRVKILHCADLHFDTPFQGITAMGGEKRREDLRETFGKIVHRVRQENIPILLMAGDIFDSERVTKNTLLYLLDKLKEIPDTRIFISPGNHDPFTPKSFYSLLNWPDNVHIFKQGVERVMIPEWNACIYGAAFVKSHEQHCLIKNFTVENPNLINLMVLHGDVIVKGQTSDYNPIQKEDIEKSGLDYLALGHKHSFAGLQKTGSTYWAYGGNPEGRGFDELGPKGVLVGQVGKGFCSLDFVEICKRRYCEERIDITGTITYEEILHKVKSIIKEEDRLKNLYKIVLTGEIDEDFTIYTSVLMDRLEEDFFFLKIEDHTKIALNPTIFETVFSLKGIYSRKMMERMESAGEEREKEILQRALKLGIRVLEEGKVEIE